MLEKPKGVEVAHRGMAHWVFWRWFTFPLTPDDPYISAMNLFFVWYWHLPLCQGGTVVIIPFQRLVATPILFLCLCRVFKIFFN